jgi:hypothetical protein
MPNFGFIVTQEFRDSLDADAKEMAVAFEGKAWKARQVIAGSIIEAVLIDFLLDRQPEALKGRDPLKLQLAEAIDLCGTEKVLNERTQSLCAVVRSYRNLIHPGRQLRLDEPPPSESTARIAMVLVDLIVTEVVRARQSAFGLTAEQILSKIEHDDNVLALLPYLLKDLRGRERKRLLLDLLSERRRSYDHPGVDQFVAVRERFDVACRRILYGTGNATRTSVANQIVDRARAEQRSQSPQYPSRESS